MEMSDLSWYDEEAAVQGQGLDGSPLCGVQGLAGDEALLLAQQLHISGESDDVPAAPLRSPLGAQTAPRPAPLSAAGTALKAASPSAWCFWAPSLQGCKSAHECHGGN